MATCVFGDYSTSLAIFKGPTWFSYPNLKIHLRVNWPFFFSKGATRNLEKTKTTEFACLRSPSAGSLNVDWEWNGSITSQHLPFTP